MLIYIYMVSSAFEIWIRLLQTYLRRMRSVAECRCFTTLLGLFWLSSTATIAIIAAKMVISRTKSKKRATAVQMQKARTWGVASNAPTLNANVFVTLVIVIDGPTDASTLDSFSGRLNRAAVSSTFRHPWSSRKASSTPTERQGCRLYMKQCLCELHLETKISLRIAICWRIIVSCIAVSSPLSSLVRLSKCNIRRVPKRSRLLEFSSFNRSCNWMNVH